MTPAELEHDPLRVARELLGCELESTSSQGVVRVRLVEMEAYRGGDDPASHSYRGRTKRNTVMFGPAGYLYVYFVYGLHFCMNVVCLADGVPGAVLLRAGEVVDGHDLAWQRRPAARKEAQLASGPARLASVLGVSREHNGVDLTTPDSSVRLYRGERIDEAEIRTGPRVGVAAAADFPWRSWVSGSPAVSSYRRGARRRTSGPGGNGFVAVRETGMRE
jgi:DNA-3-methyladenine glycosylase